MLMRPEIPARMPERATGNEIPAGDAHHLLVMAIFAVIGLAGSLAFALAFPMASESAAVFAQLGG
jgi:hypothetical protein